MIIFDSVILDMDIQAEKLDIIKWLAGINEPSIIKKFMALKQEQQVDWWDEIDAEEKAEIEEGLAQADRGEGIPHEEVMAKYQKWRTK
jgi:predicted transcriptional regulator